MPGGWQAGAAERRGPLAARREFPFGRLKSSGGGGGGSHPALSKYVLPLNLTQENNFMFCFVLCSVMFCVFYHN